MYYTRYLDKKLTNSASASKVKMLLGPRQSGKSTLLKHSLSSNKNVMSINLQDRRERIKYERDRDSLLQELDASLEVETVIIDEIQKVPELFDDVQYFFDKYPERFNFYLTGSSARQLKKHSANLLPGRTHLFRMTPVLQAEQRNTEILPLGIESENRFPMRPLDEILIYGNLPGLYGETTESWQETITTYAELYIENEIRSNNMINNMGSFLNFLKLAAIESGQTVNHSKLSSIIGVSVNTIKNYYQILEDTYIGLKIQPFGNSRKKTMSAPRFIIFDLGVRNALAELPLTSNLLNIDPGHLFEQFVLIELFYRCQCLGRSYKLSSWRLSTGAEVDAVVETPEETIPIEVKWNASPRSKDIRHLNTFLDLHSDIAHRGYLICGIDKPRKLSERITALPWNKF